MTFDATLSNRIAEAQRAEQYVFKRARAATYAFLAYGKSLHEFDIARHWAYLPDPFRNDGGEGMVPFRSFDQWLRANKQLGKSMARLALQVFRRFVIDLDISFQELCEVDVSKFQDITPEVEKLMATVTTNSDRAIVRERALEWVNSGAELSRTDINLLRSEVEGFETVVSGKMTAGGLIKRLVDARVGPNDEVFVTVRRIIVRTAYGPQERDDDRD